MIYSGNKIVIKTILTMMTINHQKRCRLLSLVHPDETVFGFDISGRQKSLVTLHIQDEEIKD